MWKENKITTLTRAANAASGVWTKHGFPCPPHLPCCFSFGLPLLLNYCSSLNLTYSSFFYFSLSLSFIFSLSFCLGFSPTFALVSLCLMLSTWYITRGYVGSVCMKGYYYKNLLYSDLESAHIVKPNPSFKSLCFTPQAVFTRIEEATHMPFSQLHNEWTWNESSQQTLMGWTSHSALFIVIVTFSSFEQQSQIQLSGPSAERRQTTWNGVHYLSCCLCQTFF